MPHRHGTPSLTSLQDDEVSCEVSFAILTFFGSEPPKVQSTIKVYGRLGGSILKNFRITKQ